MMRLLIRFFRLAPFALFIGLMLSPAVFATTASRLAAIAPLEEYRALAEWPEAGAYLGAGKPGFLGYTRQVDSWFSDNFATRPLWVRAYTQALYSIFRESDQVHVGPGDWLFYRSVVDRETPSLDRIPPEVRMQMIGRMVRLTELLEARGITLYVVPLALKPAYYPEYLPTSAAHAKHFTFYDSFMDEALADGRINLIDSRPVLTKAKAEGLKIFHQTDFHWTDPAGGLTMKAIINAISAESGRPDLANRFKFKTVPLAEFTGGQGRALPLFRTPTEVSVGVETLYPQTSFAYRMDENGVEWQGEATSAAGDLFDPVIVYGDSFFDAGSRAGFFNNFRAFARARIWRNDIVNLYRHRPAGTRFMVIQYITSATVGVDSHVSALIKHLEAEVTAEPGRGSSMSVAETIE